MCSQQTAEQDAQRQRHAEEEMSDEQMNETEEKAATANTSSVS